MRTASMVLGIIGGALALLGGLMLILLGSFFASGFFYQLDMPSDFPFELFTQFLPRFYTILGIAAMAGGAVGLAGGIMVKKKNVTGGVLLIVGAAITFRITLILAAIFAFVKEKPKAPEMAYPPMYPSYAPPYVPYPPYAPQTPPQTPSDGPAPGDSSDSPQS